MSALDPTHRISQYGHSSWKIQDGYFGGQAVSITQTTDGYIWIGTAAGVFRFDGVEFVPWTSLSGEKLQSNDVHSVLGARDGSLWIATAKGVLQWGNQRSTRYLDGHEVNAILEDEKGAIWVTRSGSGPSALPICRINGADVHCFSYGAGEGASLSAAVGLAEDPSGDLWIGHDMAVVRWKSGPTKIYWPTALRSHQGTGGIASFAAAPDGSVWVGVEASGPGGGLQRIANGVIKPFTAPKLNGETLEVEALLIDRQGNLWVGTSNQGVYRIHGNDVDHFGSADGLSGDYVNKVFEDREGNLWLANSNGLDMLRDLRVTTFTKREGLTEDTVESVLAARDGTVWIGSNHLQALVKGSILPELGKSLPGNQVTCLLEDHAGRLWVGMDSTLWVRDGLNKNGAFHQIKRKDGSAIGTVRGLAEDSEHNIWVQTNGPPATLLRLQNPNIQEEYSSPSPPRGFKMTSDPRGGIWLALAGGDLAHFRSGKTEIIRFANHPTSRIAALFADEDGSILGATGYGVAGWRDGKQQTLTARNGLPCDEVYALNEDGQHNLWLYASCGLIEIQREEVQRWWQQVEPRLRFKLFDALDGVQPGQSHFSGSSKAPDGRLWFANNSVAQVIDPAHLKGNIVPPAVHINTIVADRKRYPIQEALKLPPLTRALEIDYTAPSFTAPKKVLFRYMLEGHDAGWQEPGTRRQAFYTDLAPKKYRFRVIACNNDGVWNETGASLDFSVLPAYYQTVWFKMLCAATLLALLWALYLFRLRQLRYQFTIGMEAMVDERTRIARELHDTLLQSFQGAAFQFQAARKLLRRNADGAMQAVDDAVQAAEEGITEGRAAIRDLRPESAAQRSLPELLNAACRELAAAQELSGNAPIYQLILEGDEQHLSPMLQDEIYRISREVLRNAFAHASAANIELEIRYDHDRLRVRIRDDGKGIDPTILGDGGRPGHWGISGMRERAQRIGAQLAFWSEVGAGTEVQLTIPGAIAYKKHRDSNRSRLFRRAGSGGKSL